MRMILLRQARLTAGDEGGAVLVLFAVFAPIAVLFLAFVIDVGNSFWHARHLQLQADAGALAVAQEFQPCFQGKGAGEGADASMYSSAAQYAGAAEVSTPSGTAKATTPLHNLQIGNTKQEHIRGLINSKTYYNRSEPVDRTAVAKPPCEAGMVDVKLTETDLPWWVKVFKSAFNGVPYIDAHARVEILQETSATGLEPLAVAETAPRAAKAYFVNEDNNNEVLASVSLNKTGTSSGQDVWSNATSPVALAINKTNAKTAHIGVLIALSGDPAHTKCGEALVQCFDQQTGPLLHIAGYSNEGTGTVKAPLARQVTLSNPAPDTCTDGYFSSASGACTFTISAKVDYGSANRNGITIKPRVKGTTGSALSFNSETGLWTGAATMATGSGSNELSLLVECNSKAKESACASEAKSTSATITNVHRSYAANYEHNSGTITGAWLSEAGGLPQDANSFEVCETADKNSCTHQLVVTLDVGGSLAAAQGFSDRIRQLRWEGEQGVRVGCPPPAKPSGNEYREKLEGACPGTYKINSSDPECTRDTSPYECVTVGLPGKDTGPTQQGIDERIENDPGKRFYCPNNWTEENSKEGGVPVIPSDDSRLVRLFVIPYGTIDAEGRSTLGREEVPIQDFADFYVMGFPGDKCKADPNTGNAEIVGHFIKYVSVLGSGEEEHKCSAESLGECVAVLTR
jgi:hypothetical protein